jgi:hypothetical protein
LTRVWFLHQRAQRAETRTDRVVDAIYTPVPTLLDASLTRTAFPESVIIRPCGFRHFPDVPFRIFFGLRFAA